MSPTSILEPFLGLRNSFWGESNSPRTQLTESKRPWDSKGIGLAIVDGLTEENSDPKPSKPDTRMVVLGSQLKIQIPPLPPFVSTVDDSPISPIEFGIKRRNSHLGSLSPVSSLSPAKKSAFGFSSSGQETPNSPLVFTGCLSAGEIEQSEDYTCVISHGPNPKTTHIFGDCVIESGSGVYSPVRKENGYFRDRTSFSPENFLSFCNNCKKNLEEGKDIYMYRYESKTEIPPLVSCSCCWIWIMSHGYEFLQRWKGILQPWMSIPRDDVRGRRRRGLNWRKSMGITGNIIVMIIND